MQTKYLEFVKAWQAGENVQKIATGLGIKPSTAQNRARMLRKAGVPLKKFNEGLKGIDLDALKAAAQ